MALLQLGRERARIDRDGQHRVAFAFAGDLRARCQEYQLAEGSVEPPPTIGITLDAVDREMKGRLRVTAAYGVCEAAAAPGESDARTSYAVQPEAVLPRTVDYPRMMAIALGDPGADLIGIVALEAMGRGWWKGNDHQPVRATVQGNAPFA